MRIWQSVWTRIVLFELVVMLSGCGIIPTENTENKPTGIKADGDQYFACHAFTLSSNSSWGTTTYEVSFSDPSRGGGKVELKGIRKLEIVELPSMVDAPMPSFLPDITTDHLADGSSYKEGQVYTWENGTKAIIHGGKWVAVKVPNTVCNIDSH